MNRELILELFNKHMRIDITYPSSRRERTASVIRKVSLTNEPGFILFSEMDESIADAVIDEQLTYFKKLKQQFEWKVFDYDQPLNLRSRLQSRGFTIGEQEALMIYDLIEGDQLLDIAAHPDIRRITDEQGIWDIIELENEIWGESHQELGKQLVKDLHNDAEDLLVYAAYVNGKAVSAPWMYLHEGTPFASLWGGSTLSEYRKRGYYSSLIGIRAREAVKRGYRFLMVDASSMSQPILEKQGFECIAWSTPCMSPEIK